MLPVNEEHRQTLPPLDIPNRLLLGPGPANVHPRVLEAMGTHQVGHLDPVFVKIMNENQALLRYAWQTSNRLTIPVSGTGSAAMEATIANVIEPGDTILIGINGYFGHRLVDMAERYGAVVKTMHRPWGEAFSLEEIEAGLKAHRPAVLALVHAETSTGARQPLEGVADLCHAQDCLLLIDTVTSLAGVPLFLDEWGVDAAYSGTQKCFGAPPGLAPLTMSDRAVDKLMNRKNKVPNWYLDMTMVTAYWGESRTYHHTAPINMNYGFREALRMIAEEGLEARWARHQATAEAFWDGLAEIGLECQVDKEIRLPSLTTVKIPEGVDGGAVAVRLRDEYNIEIAGGLGELKGKVWRVGFMGYNSRPENVERLLGAFQEILA